MKKACIKVVVAVVLLCGSINLSGCGLLYNTYENVAFTEVGTEVVIENTKPQDEYVTGAWQEGMFWCGDYRVDLECPEAGHPSGSADSEWSTGCKLDDGTSVNVDFFSREGSVETRIAELENEGVTVEEGVLWENPCNFYMDDEKIVTIVFIRADENNYVEIVFESWDGDAVPFEEIPDEFTFTIADKF